MPYPNDSTVRLQTIITSIGRKLMAQGNFLPATFIISDAGVDYGDYIISDPPTSTDGAIIESMPIPLQTEYSPYYPLFNKLPGVETTYVMSLKGNTSTSFSLNSSKSYQIFPTTSDGLVETYRMIISNTRYFSNTFSNLNTSRYTATVDGESFVLNTVSNITTIAGVYGTSFQITLLGLKSGAKLNLTFTFNPLGQPAQS